MRRRGPHGREIETEVKLNVYDLSPANDFLRPVALGVYHSGVEVFGSEHTFAGGAGVFHHTPLTPPGFEAEPAAGGGAAAQGQGPIAPVFREQIVLGKTTKSQHEIEDITRKLHDRYEGERNGRGRGGRGGGGVGGEGRRPSP